MAADGADEGGDDALGAGADLAGADSFERCFRAGVQVAGLVPAEKSPELMSQLVLCSGNDDNRGGQQGPAAGRTPVESAA